MYTGFTFLRVWTLKEWRRVLIMGLNCASGTVFVHCFVILNSREKKNIFIFSMWDKDYTHVFMCNDLGRGRVFIFFNMKQSFMVEFWYFFNFIKDSLRLIYHSLVIYFRHFNILCNINRGLKEIILVLIKKIKSIYLIKILSIFILSKIILQAFFSVV